MYYDYKKNLLDMVAYKYIENAISPLLGLFDC